MSAEHLLRTLRSGRAAFGAWCALDDSAVVEAISLVGLDWLVIDCEHGVVSAANAFPLLQVVRGQTTALVRLPEADPAAAARVLDAGAGGVVVPRVDSAEEAARMVAACRYPPAGRRGVGPHRAAQYYQDRRYLEEANERVAVVAQIESRAALDALDVILEVEALSALFVGPADLAASLGHFAEPTHAEVQEAIAEVLERCRAAGMPAGIYCGSGREARERVAMGFQMVNVAHDLGVLVAGVTRELRRARSQ